MVEWRKYSQYAAAFAASLLAVAAGNATAWTTPILTILLSPESPLNEKITDKQIGILTSCLPLGNIFGNIFVGPILNKIGRRGCLLVCSIPLAAMWVLILFAKVVEIIYLARFCIGFLGAFPIGACFVYITEISQTHVRGKLGILVMFMLEIGQLMVTIAGSYMSYRDVALLCSLVPIMFFAIFYWFPESPYHFLKKSDREGADKSMRRLRHGSVSEELNLIAVNIEQDMEKKSGIRDVLFSNEYRKELIIVLGLKSLHQLSGNVAIQSYMGMIFLLANTGINTAMSIIICTAITIPAMFVSFYAVDRFGRKPLYYVSTIGCTISLLFEFTYFLLKNTLKMQMDNFAWLPLTGIFLFFIFRSLGVTTLSGLLMGELFPTNVKGAAVSISLFFGSTLSFFVALGFPTLSGFWGISTSFLLFAVACFCGFMFVLFCVPETKGKTLAEIQSQIRKQHTKL